MIKVFRATDTNYTTNGEIILKPIEAVITKNYEEEYIELESPLKYADFLVQENILVVDTLTGKKGYRIHNPIVSNTISVKAWLFYQEAISTPSDRGAVISHGKNLANCKVTENWDDVVTKLIPLGYNGARLSEGYLSVVSPYQRTYEKTIEFDLTESLVDEVEVFEEDISINDSLVTSLTNSVFLLNAKIPSYDSTVASLQAEIAALQQRLSELGTSELELKEKAVIEAQIPLINDEITAIGVEKVDTQTLLTQAQADLVTAKADLAIAKSAYDSLVVTDLRNQAQDYLNINQYPQINYDLEAHLNGIVEVGDTVKIKHPDMRVDLLANVTALKLDCLTMKFRQVEFGTKKPTLKGKLTNIEAKIDKVNDTTKKLGNTITKYKSEYKRDNEEMVSKFTSELYGLNNGLYGMIEKNQSVLRQTASEISGTVSRVNVNLSSDISKVSIKADGIKLTVTANYNTLNSSIASVDIKANQILSVVQLVDNDLTTAKSTITQQAGLINLRVEKNKVISEINQTAESIKISASKLNLEGLVTVTSLSTPGAVVIDGGNLKADSIVAESIKAGGTITGAKFTNGAVTIDDSNIILNTSGGFKYKYGGYLYDLMSFNGGNSVTFGPSAYFGNSYLYFKQNYIYIGNSNSTTSIYMQCLKLGLYGAAPVSKQSVDKVYTASVSLSNLAARFNTLLTALDLLGAIEGSSSS